MEVSTVKMLQVYYAILLLYVTDFYVPVQATNYYFSFCWPPYVRNATFQLVSGMTGSINATSVQGPQYDDGLDCTLELSPPLLGGIVLTVQEINLRGGIFYGCEDTIAISEFSNGRWRVRMTDQCSPWRSYYKNDGPMRINFKTSKTSTGSKIGRGFQIIYTAYEDPPCLSSSFRCSNYICIPQRLKCDKVNNCGDNSDERSSECHKVIYPSYTVSRNPGAIIGGAVGGFIFVVIVFSIVMLLCRRNRVIVRSTTNMSPSQPTTIYPQQNYTYDYQQGQQLPPPPPYFQQQPVAPQPPYYTQPQP